MFLFMRGRDHNSCDEILYVLYVGHFGEAYIEVGPGEQLFLQSRVCGF